MKVIEGHEVIGQMALVEIVFDVVDSLGVIWSFAWDASVIVQSARGPSRVAKVSA